MARRKAAFSTDLAEREKARGYSGLYAREVLQADEGCDFDFLRGKTPVRSEDTVGPSHA